MTITKLHEIWNVSDERFPRDAWFHLQNIYEIIQNNIQLKPDDFLPSAPNSIEPKWMRNVRNVIQQRKCFGDIAWNKNGKYMIPTKEIFFQMTVLQRHQKSNTKSQKNDLAILSMLGLDAFDQSCQTNFYRESRFGSVILL